MSRYGTMYGMRRTTVYLPDDLTAALDRTAQAQGKSKAEVIRAAIAVATSGDGRLRPRIPLFHSGDPTLAERIDAELHDGFGE